MRHREGGDRLPQELELRSKVGLGVDGPTVAAEGEDDSGLFADPAVALEC